LATSRAVLTEKNLRGAMAPGCKVEEKLSGSKPRRKFFDHALSEYRGWLFIHKKAA